MVSTEVKIPATAQQPVQQPNEVPAKSAGINRNSPIPYYYQLERVLRQQIVDGTWREGEQILSERQLCERYGVSRPTVRQAIGRLVQDGLLYHVKGKGTFVTRRSQST